MVFVVLVYWIVQAEAMNYWRWLECNAIRCYKLKKNISIAHGKRCTWIQRFPVTSICKASLLACLLGWSLDCTLRKGLVDTVFWCLQGSLVYHEEDASRGSHARLACLCIRVRSYAHEWTWQKWSGTRSFGLNEAQQLYAPDQRRDSVLQVPWWYHSNADVACYVAGKHW